MQPPVNHRLYVWLTTSLLLGWSTAQAQYPESAPSSVLTSNHVIRSLCDWVSPHGWLRFRAEARLQPDALFTIYAADMGLGPGDEMRLARHWQDADGTHHWRYQQYHRGLLVEGGEYTLHGSSKQLHLAHGKLIEGLHLPTGRLIHEGQALRRALAALGPRVYAWENEEWQLALQADRQDPQASHYPQGELRMGFVDGKHLAAAQYRPAWVFTLRSLVPDALETVYIDALTGEVLQIRSPRRHCTSRTGTAHTLHHEYRSLDLQRRGFPFADYILRDCRGLHGIHTKKHIRNSFGATRGWGWIAQVSYHQPGWQGHEQAASTAHWAAQQAWDYFAGTFGRAGMDGQGRSLRLLVDWVDENGQPVPDAMFEPGQGQADYLYLGNRQGHSLALPEIVGHEYTHGIVAATAGLAYERESGALEESFADIFGILIEQYAEQADLPDWLIGEDAGTLRSLADPAAFGQPAAYGALDPRWVDAAADACPEPLGALSPSSNDFCGVHTNSGVQNRWFYLLAMGHEDEDRPVAPIGVAAAAHITYRNLTVYMQHRSNYQDARLGSIQAAIDLYGPCANEVAQVKNAWAAVGLGPGNDTLCVEIEGPGTICTLMATNPYSFRAEALQGSSFIWDPLPSGWEYHLSGPAGEWLHLTQVGDSPEEATLTVTAFYAGLSHTATQTLRLEACENESDFPPPLNREEYPHLSLFPNPARGRIIVRLPRRLYPASLEVIDLQGRHLLSDISHSATHKLSLLGLAPGYYILRVQTPHSVEVRSFEVLP